MQDLKLSDSHREVDFIANYYIFSLEEYLVVYLLAVFGKRGKNHPQREDSYCGGGAPANKWYENKRFNSTETMYCRLGKQALMDVVLDYLECKYSLQFVSGSSPMERVSRLREQMKLVDKSSTFPKNSINVSESELPKWKYKTEFCDGDDEDWAKWLKWDDWNKEM